MTVQTARMVTHQGFYTNLWLTKEVSKHSSVQFQRLPPTSKIV